MMLAIQKKNNFSLINKSLFVILIIVIGGEILLIVRSIIILIQNYKKKITIIDQLKDLENEDIILESTPDLQKNLKTTKIYNPTKNFLNFLVDVYKNKNFYDNKKLLKKLDFYKKILPYTNLLEKLFITCKIIDYFIRYKIHNDLLITIPYAVNHKQIYSFIWAKNTISNIKSEKIKKKFIKYCGLESVLANDLMQSSVNQLLKLKIKQRENK